MGEQRIIIAGGIILSVGVARAYMQKQPLDVPIVGGLALILLLSVIAAFGSAEAELAGDIAMLALLTVIIAEGAPLLAKASNL